MQEGESLCLFDPARQEFLPTPLELNRQVEAVAIARQATEAENERLRAEIAALKAAKANGNGEG